MLSDTKDQFEKILKDFLRFHPFYSELLTKDSVQTKAP